MKLFIIILCAFCILFIVLAVMLSKKKQPGLTPPKVHTQACNIHDTILCDTTTECENTCKDSTGSKCYHLYYQNYIWPFYQTSPSTGETIAEMNPPSARIFKMFNEPSSFNNLEYIMFNDVVISPSKTISSASPSIFGYATYIGDTIGTTSANFPPLVQGFSQPMGSLSPSSRKSRGLPPIQLPDGDISNLVPKIDHVKNNLPTCMHTDKVCAYWQYYTEPFVGYTFCGGDPQAPTGPPDSQVCKKSEMYYGNYYQLDNLINLSPSDIATFPSDISNMSPQQATCYSNINCTGYLESPQERYVYTAKPNFSGVPYNTYSSVSRKSTDVCLPEWSPSNLSPTNQIKLRPPEYCPPSLSPSQKQTFVLNPNHLDAYTFTKMSPSDVPKSGTGLYTSDIQNQCIYKVDTTLSTAPPTSYHTLAKACTPSEFNINTIKNFTNFQKKTCNIYDSIDMQKLSPHFSPTIPLNQRMYNAEQICNNQSSCIWRDIMTGSSWELVDNIIAPSCTKDSQCTKLDKLNYVYSRLFPTERLIYQTTETGTSSGTSQSPTKSTITKEFCKEDDETSNVCETLLGITPISPSSIQEDKKYSYKIIKFGCADMISDINNKVGTTVVKPENNYLYYNHLLCDYKKQCYLDYRKKLAPTKQKVGIKYNNLTAAAEFECNPTNPPSESFLNEAINNCNATYVNKINDITSQIEQVQSEIPAWKQTPFNRKTGVCLKPPNTFMSDNPCNLYTARSIVTRGQFNSDPVCNALGPENCNDDMFCYKEESGDKCQCKGYCETSPTINSTSNEAERRIKCEQAGTCMYVHNSPTPCQSMKNNWQCECLNNPYIQNLFEDSNNRCDKLQPTRDIPNVVYYEDKTDINNEKLYMQYSNNCCHFENKNSPSAPAPSSLNKNDIFASSEIPERFRQKCEQNICSTGDRVFGQLVIPDCGLIATKDCEPNMNQPNSVDQTWPCELRSIAPGSPTQVCANKKQYEPGRVWETDCYQTGGDGEKQFTYDTCWNPLYGVLSPCGIEYPNNAYNGDLPTFFNKKCILASCCDQDYPVTPIEIADQILKKPID